MRRLDYYVILSILLIVWLVMLYMWENLYSGLFLGWFLTKIESLLWINHEQVKKVIEDYSWKQPEIFEDYDISIK